MGIAAGIGAAASVAGAASSIAGGAAGSKAAGQAASTSKEEQAQMRQDLLPYNTAGQAVLPAQQALALSGPNAGGPDYIGEAHGNLPLLMTEQQLEQTPGYQFTRDQGLKAVQSARAARGLGVSGAALKGAATFATGLADSTYSNRFNEAQQRFADILNLNTGYQQNVTNAAARMNQLSSTGESAAAQTGTTGAALAGQQGNALIQGGEATGAGIAGVGSALSKGVNSYLSANALQQGTGGGSDNSAYQAGAFSQLPAGTYGPNQ
jgi:hypothetical protein